MAKPYKRKESRFYYIAPMINGAQVPQSSGTTDYAAALQKLRELEGNIASGQVQNSKCDRGSFGELLEDVKVDYLIKKRRSYKNLERQVRKHLVPKLGHIRAKHVTSSVIGRYILDRQEEGAENSSINQELRTIKRAMRLAGIAGKISRVPHVEMLPTEDSDAAFYSPEQLQTVLRHCHALAGSILQFAYITGWRITSILKLEWRNVDLKTGFVWLNATETKNRKAVRWPLMAGLGEIIDERRRLTDLDERRLERIIPFVFHRSGKRVKSIRRAWELARIAAGLPGYVIHDFRGTATVNLLEAGVDITKVMSMVGFKTVQMVQHYASKRGAREESLIEAASKLENRLGIVSSKKTTTAGTKE